LMVMLPVHRRGLLSNEALLGYLREALPAEISERVVQKMQQELPVHRGNLVFQIRPRSVLKPDPIDTHRDTLFLMRIGFAWAEKRDMPTSLQ